ncbi:response regulator [Leptolyngbya sp. FACHB-17]|uniref:response regulator n=1 Tax=Leptolyngbyales TaxID=3079749 RepID=UPI0016802C38|nr:response regulator [Leptolyngbya sp. FACHB-17]MBD2082880.1 response regulator [Leptolyngbya sp. FACHB-17]
MTQPTILFAEDNQGDVLLAKRAFRQLNKLDGPYELRIVANGEEAIDYLSGQGKYVDRHRYPMPALLLLDLKMPRRSGFEVMEWIQQQIGLDIPTVILTTSTDPKDENRAYQLGAKLYLLKPITLDILNNLLTQIPLPS